MLTFVQNTHSSTNDKNLFWLIFHSSKSLSSLRFTQYLWKIPYTTDGEPLLKNLIFISIYFSLKYMKKGKII